MIIKRTIDVLSCCPILKHLPTVLLALILTASACACALGNLPETIPELDVKSNQFFWQAPLGLK